MTARGSQIPCALAAIVVGTCLLVGCRGSGNAVELGDEPRPGGTAVIGSISDVDSWNEYLSRQSAAVGILRRIFLRLAVPAAEQPGRPATYAPQLAESWSFSEDGLSLTFRIREATWSDGKPVSAADVRFTWLAQTSPEVPWIGASSKEQISDVTVDDEKTVTFHFLRSYPYQLGDAVDGGILPEHVYGAVPFEDWVTHDWAANPVGCGPFRLATHEPGQQIVLERNERYFRDRRPFLDRVVVRIVPDAGNLLTQLKAGAIDYMEGVTPRQAQQLSNDRELTLLPFDFPNYDYLGWNGSRPPFDAPSMRRALTLAIDRPALIEDLLYGYAQASHGPIPSSRWGVDRTLEPWPHDPAAAARILADHGYATLDPDSGKRIDGTALRIELMTNSGNRVREAMLVKLQEQLSRIGIEVRLQSLEMGTLRRRAAAGDYDGYLGGWTFTGRVEIKALFGSSYVPPSGANVVFYESAEIDSLLAECDTAPDFTSLEPLLARIQQQIHADQPYTFLYEAQRIAVHGSRLHGVTIDRPSDSLAHLEEFWGGR